VAIRSSPAPGFRLLVTASYPPLGVALAVENVEVQVVGHARHEGMPERRAILDGQSDPDEDLVRQADQRGVPIEHEGVDLQRQTIAESAPEPFGVEHAPGLDGDQEGDASGAVGALEHFPAARDLLGRDLDQGRLHRGGAHPQSGLGQRTGFRQRGHQSVGERVPDADRLGLAGLRGVAGDVDMIDVPGGALGEERDEGGRPGGSGGGAEVALEAPGEHARIIRAPGVVAGKRRDVHREHGEGTQRHAARRLAEQEAGQVGVDGPRRRDDPRVFLAGVEDHRTVAQVVPPVESESVLPGAHEFEPRGSRSGGRRRQGVGDRRDIAREQVDGLVRVGALLLHRASMPEVALDAVVFGAAMGMGGEDDQVADGDSGESGGAGAGGFGEVAGDEAKIAEGDPRAGRALFDDQCLDEERVVGAPGEGLEERAVHPVAGRWRDVGLGKPHAERGLPRRGEGDRLGRGRGRSREAGQPENRTEQQEDDRADAQRRVLGSAPGSAGSPAYGARTRRAGTEWKHRRARRGDPDSEYQSAQWARAGFRGRPVSEASRSASSLSCCNRVSTTQREGIGRVDGVSRNQARSEAISRRRSESRSQVLGTWACALADWLGCEVPGKVREEGSGSGRAEKSSSSGTVMPPVNAGIVPDRERRATTGSKPLPPNELHGRGSGDGGFRGRAGAARDRGAFAMQPPCICMVGWKSSPVPRAFEPMAVRPAELNPIRTPGSAASPRAS
jgi:hypothetical protein